MTATKEASSRRLPSGVLLMIQIVTGLATNTTNAMYAVNAKKVAADITTLFFFCPIRYAMSIAPNMMLKKSAMRLADMASLPSLEVRRWRSLRVQVRTV